METKVFILTPHESEVYGVYNSEELAWDYARKQVISEGYGADINPDGSVDDWFVVEAVLQEA